jgi:glycine cleavage system H protein
MSEPLVFMMGEFEAQFPTDRKYATNHMWATELDRSSEVNGGTYRFGFTAYAVRLLQDVYFLEWMVDPGVDLQHRQEIGAIESKKAESALYAPVAGQLARFNDELLADPSTINVDKYGKGWLFELDGATGALITPEEYIEHLTAVWEVTQRTIKGQLNE